MHNFEFQPFRFRWVPGNLPFDSLCTVCEEPAGDGPGIKDLRCVWCQRTLHTDCQKAAQVPYLDTGTNSTGTHFNH
jgi:hypothetical protein